MLVLPGPLALLRHLRLFLRRHLVDGVVRLLPDVCPIDESSHATFLSLVEEKILGNALVEGVVGVITPYLLVESAPAPSLLRSAASALLDSPLLHDGTALADFLVDGSWENYSQSADNFVSGVLGHFKTILDSALAENLLAQLQHFAKEYLVDY